MGEVIPFPDRKAVPVSALTEQECDAVHAEIHDLMLNGLATGVSLQDERKSFWVFDCHGAPYCISREEGICYLYEGDDTLLAHSARFAIVLQALKAILSLGPETAAYPDPAYVD